MKQLYPLIVGVFMSLSCYSQLCYQAGCATIYGNGTGYQQANLNTLYSNTPQAGVKDVEVFGWTANGAGVPIFNGRTALKFNFSAVPARATITSAKIYLQGKSANAIRPGQGTYTESSNASYIQKITSLWSETTATWNNQPAANTTNQKTIAKSASNNQNYVIDITDFVQEWVNDASKNNGMLIRLQTEQAYNCMMFYGGNAASNTDKLRIEVCYEASATTGNNVAIYGNKTGKFTNVLINNNYNNNGFSRYTEISAAAWTANSIGFPVFNNRALLRYDVSEIPANATINAARLYLFPKTNPINGNKVDAMFGTANTSLLQKIVQVWDTTGTTTGWTNQPTVATSTQKTLSQSTSPTQPYEVDVTDFVQQWVNKPDSNFGMLLRIQNEAIYNSMTFENDIKAADGVQPRLEICYSNASVLPLVLTNFHGNFSTQTSNLYWNTANEQNVQLIEVQRGYDGNRFTAIGTVPATNTLQNHSYQFTDANTGGFTKVYYRLKLVNKDGSFMYSNTLLFKAGTMANSNLTLTPNPAKNYTQISITAQNNQQCAIVVVDMAGKIISTSQYKLLKGTNNILLNNLGSLTAGNYFVRSTVDGKVVGQLLQVQ